MRAVRAVLFDLDGTLIDSAPDLAGTANDMRVHRGWPPLPLAELRLHCGSGARGMLGAGLGRRPDDAGYADLREEFLSRYEARMLRDTAPFASVTSLLDTLNRRGLPWGIVTNKTLRLASALVQAIVPLRAAAVLIGGDSTAHTKPHPEPLLEAARRMDLLPGRCVYVGDDPRDVRAGQAAGMPTLAAAWGYLGPDEPVQAWGADAVLLQPEELLKWLDLA